jgi:RHS repeat-associated protein
LVPNAPPTVSLTSPTNGSAFIAPASITLTATATDSDGTIQKVEFFHGGTNLIATVTTAPYTFPWTAVPQGSYVLTAVATDNQTATTTSAPVNVTVQAAAALYFVEVDHLNTPRLVANDAQQAVWRWDQQEPFGVNVPDENPLSLGAFEFPLRFPGQYADKETNLHYNYFRDYDPSIGRYEQSDLIGLRGGLNTYAYVMAQPLRYFDPAGLSAEMCTRPVAIPLVPGQHCFIRFNGDNSDTASYDPTGVHPDPKPENAHCKAIGGDDDDCLKREMKNCKGSDFHFLKKNCCNCVEDAIKKCRLSFPAKSYPNWPINPGPLPGESGGK